MKILTTNTTGTFGRWTRLLGALLAVVQLGFSQVILVEDFSYTAATLLTVNGWSAHSGTGTNSVAVTSPGLSYSSYLGSGIGNAALVGALGGEDVNLNFPDQAGNEKTLYFSFLVNVNDTALSRSGDYFFHSGNRTNPTTFTFFATRVFARIVSGQVNFGLSNTSTATYGASNFAKNTTYLLIVKYAINTAGNDTTSLWVISSGVPATETAAGVAEVTNTSTAGQDTIDAVALRQGSTTQPQTVVDGIRVGLDFASVTSAPVSRAQVNLGTAGDFAILAKTGVSTTGVTSITGDIGLSPAAATFITGFGLIMDASGTFSTSSLVTGKVYAADYTPPTPAKMTTAVSDMETAYTDAAGRTLPDYTELYAGDVTGKTLTRGLYKWGTGVLISAGGVTISGAETDVWIFQIAQNLTVANGAIITLSGGAQASNIFWQVAGQATLGTTAAMKGIILCQTLIEMQTGATLNGRALAQSAVTLDASTVTRPVLTTVENGLAPTGFTLAQNYPNPFNPSTMIEYSLEKPGMVSLKVYNLLGHEIATLVNGRQEAGSYTVPFNTNKGTLNLSSGVYFYRLDVGSFGLMKKLILVK